MMMKCQTCGGVGSLHVIGGCPPCKGTGQVPDTNHAIALLRKVVYCRDGFVLVDIRSEIDEHLRDVDR